MFCGVLSVGGSARICPRNAGEPVVARLAEKAGEPVAAWANGRWVMLPPEDEGVGRDVAFIPTAGVVCEEGAGRGFGRPGRELPRAGNLADEGGAGRGCGRELPRSGNLADEGGPNASAPKAAFWSLKISSAGGLLGGGRVYVVDAKSNSLIWSRSNWGRPGGSDCGFWRESVGKEARADGLRVDSSSLGGSSSREVLSPQSLQGGERRACVVGDALLK